MFATRKFFIIPFFIFILQLVNAAEPVQAIRIVSTLFPQYDFARRIGGSRVESRLLLPPGVDCHSYEPTPSDMALIADSDLFLFTGDAMEPWAVRIGKAVFGAECDARMIDVSRGVALMGDDADDHEGHDHGHGRDHALDPHFWLDPNLAATLADNLVEALERIDPEHAALYRDNAAALKDDLSDLDAESRRLTSAPRVRVLVFGGKFAFSYFTRRYGLEHVGVYDGCGPGVEPSLRRVLEVIEYIREHDIRVVYHEELSAPRIAGSIAGETGAKPMMLHSLHNLGRDEFEAGLTYVDIMRRNISSIAAGLE